MFRNLITSYTQAINNGAIPNIQNAWHYICASECLKASIQAFDIYEKTSKDILLSKLPLSLEVLKVYH